MTDWEQVIGLLGGLFFFIAGLTSLELILGRSELKIALIFIMLGMFFLFIFWDNNKEIR